MRVLDKSVVDEDFAQFRRKTQKARNERCARCARRGVRVGMQDEQFVVDVLCHACFEHAPMAFKISSVPSQPPAQDVYRSAIKGGVHPRMAQRMAEVYGRFVWPNDAN
jgi:hypothetical protein